MVYGRIDLSGSRGGGKYIVKDVVNLQVKRQVQLLLNDTEELLEHVFHSSKEVPMMILNGTLKILNVNAAFLRLFELKEAPPEQSRITDLPHPFWKDEKIGNDLRQILVKNTSLKNHAYILNTGSGEKKSFLLSSKIINRPSGLGKNIFLLIEEV